MTYLNSKCSTAFEIIQFTKIFYTHSFFWMVSIPKSENMVKCNGLKVESCILFSCMFNGMHTMCTLLSLVSETFCMLIGWHRHTLF